MNHQWKPWKATGKKEFLVVVQLQIDRLKTIPTYLIFHKPTI